MSIIRRTKLMLLLMILIAAGLVITGPVPGEAQAYKLEERQLALFREVMGKIQNDYVREVPDKELVEGAVNGMLQSLDPHSSYLTEDLFKELREESVGEFGGLGIEISLEHGVLTVISPMDDTPAFKAGLISGDKITKINGESTKNMPLMEAVKKMRGPRGTQITISVVREGRDPVDYTIVRDVIHVHSVKSQLLENGYGYIRLTGFQEHSASDLADAIRNLNDKGPLKGMILDLRSNPGGLLDQAVRVSNLFIEKGLIVYTDGRNVEQRMEFRANHPGEYYKLRLAVLINQGSASASEIVAGCLQDHERSLVFGTKSFGKASVQTIIPLEEGGALRLTTAYYYTPRGRHIQKKGILPDVDLTKELEKQRDKEFADANKTGHEKKKKGSLRNAEVDPATDLDVAKALEWLKLNQTVEQFKVGQEMKSQAAKTSHVK